MEIKKIIAAVTALVLVGGACNVTEGKNVISSVCAADTEASAEVVKDGIKYKISNGEAIVSGAEDDSIVDLVIPDEVDGCPVTAIGYCAFDASSSGCRHIKSVVLGKNVKKIDSQAFDECYELETVTLNDELESIGTYAFSGCFSLKEVKTGSKLKEIKRDAFCLCVNLKSFEIGESVEEIQSGAFQRTGIEVFEVPERFEKAENVFVSYDIPKEYCGIVKIKNPECELCDETRWENTLIVCDENSNARYQAERYKLNWCTFEQFENGDYDKQELSALDPLITLRDYGMSFKETNGGLKVEEIPMVKDGTLVIPDEVDGIPVVEFGMYTEGIQYIRINSRVAEDVKEIVLGKNVKRITERGFEEFRNLEVIEGGEGLEEIGKYAFGRLDKVKSISFSDNIRNIKFNPCDDFLSELAYGMEFDESEGELVITDISESALEDGTLVIPDEVQGMPVAYLNAAGTKKLASSTESEGYTLSVYVYPSYRSNFIPSEVKKQIKKVVIGKNLKVIPLETFSGCKNLESIEGGEGVEYIGNEAFANCEKLASLKLYDNVIEMNDSAFSGCTNLKKVEIGNGLKEIEDKAFSGCTNLKEVKFGNGLKEIGNSSFKGCEALEEISLPDSLSEIGWYAFNGTDMKTIIIPENVKNIGVDSFTWKDDASEEKVIVKIYSANCDLYSNSIDLKKVEKIYGYADSTAKKIAKINGVDFYAFGDANGDDGVDMSDVVLVMQSLANPNKYGINGTDEHHITEKGIDCADVEGNGNGITSSDALKIQKYLLGQENFS
ncbi:leucine-rich repeat protein [Ruminococcus sp.]|uniref:leucine-rich repeat protein n=1 Tax=Ruminococcus sp. TaxID=41978 RepID=UPI0025E4425F|nr:leucine-rich repeat protein [Ruminococcus sp.]